MSALSSTSSSSASITTLPCLTPSTYEHESCPPLIYLRVNSDRDELQFRVNLQLPADVELVQVVDEWKPKTSFWHFLRYDATSLFRKPKRLLYVHPVAQLVDYRRLDFADLLTVLADPKLPAFCQSERVVMVFVLPVDEDIAIGTGGTWMRAPNVNEWSVGGEAPPSQLSQLSPSARVASFSTFSEACLAQWGHLQPEQLSRLCLQYPLLWNAHTLDHFVTHLHVMRPLMTQWLPMLVVWKAKDFMRRQAFFAAVDATMSMLALFGVRDNGSDEYEFQKGITLDMMTLTLRHWAGQRRSMQLTFQWFYERALRSRQRESTCKTSWLAVWRDRDHWLPAQLAQYIDPYEQLPENCPGGWNAVLPPVAPLHTPHDPLWRHGRLPPPASASTKSSDLQKNWFAYLRRIGRSVM